jgi:hypothetical protein
MLIFPQSIVKYFYFREVACILWTLWSKVHMVLVPVVMITTIYLYCITDFLAASHCATKTGQFMWYVWDNNYQVAADKSVAFLY